MPPTGCLATICVPRGCETPSSTKSVVLCNATLCPVPVPFTEHASGVATDAATLNGRILSFVGDVRWHFEYGTVPNVYPFSTPDEDGPIGDLHVSAPVTGLSPATTYFVRLVIVGCGIIQFGEPVPFTTAGASQAAGAAPAQGPAGGTNDAGATATDTVAPQATVMGLATATPRAAKAKKAKKAKKARRHRRARRR